MLEKSSLFLCIDFFLNFIIPAFADDSYKFTTVEILHESLELDIDKFLWVFIKNVIDDGGCLVADKGNVRNLGLGHHEVFKSRDVKV